jgi:hypothetical protein
LILYRCGRLFSFRHGAYIVIILLRSSRGRPLNASAVFIHPCQPIVAKQPPSGPGWAHELKHDGYRLQILGDKDDHVVLDGGRAIGRIFQQPQAPSGRPWFWTITAMDYPRTIHSRGYSATREQAMADFKKKWLC